MRKLITLFLLVVAVAVHAQSAAQARKVLDKVAAVVGRPGGCSAQFSFSAGKGRSFSGTIAIKGRKFYASTAQGKVWYDGRTQWSYLKSTGEVNISTPTEAQQAQMNPYQFLSVYKSGYNLSMKRAGRGYVVTMKATNRARAMKTIVVTVGSNYVPSKVQYLQGGRWTTITLSRFQAKNQSDATFRFNKRMCPGAEIIDLR